MTNLIRSNFQDHPFHLVSPSPWPLYTSIALFTVTVNGALSMHLFSNSYIVFYLSLITLVASMAFWFRDIIAEGKLKLNTIVLRTQQALNYYLNIAQKIPSIHLEEALYTYRNKNNTTIFTNNNNLGYYLAGLLEGDGSISLPSTNTGVTSLNRVLNPRIVFTSHINNIGMYSFIQSELGNIGRFQGASSSGENILRYIIGDIESIILFINLVHGKLRTPKNQRFNDLINFMNNKYDLNISESLLDNSSFTDNSWFSGFSEADGHFGIKYVGGRACAAIFAAPNPAGISTKIRKPKSETRKRSVSENISLKFRLDQRLYDKATSTSMKPFMENLALFLNANLKTYKNNTNSEVLSVSIQSIKNVSFLIDYFNKFPLIGDKLTDFKKWEIVYNMIILKQHLTEEGRLKIKNLLVK
jgi:hypothetical protein|uniref:Cytochrome c oxidase subunit 3 n=2 Tax=Fusarium sambucinum species complex TaxID=569360 RepID=A0A060QN72_FUSCU